MKMHSNLRTLMILVLAAIAILLGIGSQTLSSVEAQEKFQPPTPVPASAMTPAPKPGDDRQIAILNLTVFTSAEGQIENITLDKGRIIYGYAPNVFGIAGQWTIELVGKQVYHFKTSDPRQVHVLDGNEEVPHSTFILTGKFPWELVVPLYSKAIDLGIVTINIYDENDQLIYSTPVNREEWLKLGQIQ